jgi:hypothetical protein
VLYDALQSVPQNDGLNREYWEACLVHVSSGIIRRLLPAAELEANNPSFAQNDDRIIVFDLLDYNKGAAAIGLSTFLDR